jgi:hypothetical protein
MVIAMCARRRSSTGAERVIIERTVVIEAAPTLDLTGLLACYAAGHGLAVADAQVLFVHGARRLAYNPDTGDIALVRRITN